MLPSLLLCHKSPGLANLTVGDLCLSRLPAVTTGQLLSFLLQLSYSHSRVIVARACSKRQYMPASYVLVPGGAICELSRGHQC